ncbi:MAG TPA: ABC transporter substrate-binding protein [Campylobacterales bacterium]|nr:ABC transporter substrate-binding protein [Campylobacterales bacterium]
MQNLKIFLLLCLAVSQLFAFKAIDAVGREVEIKKDVKKVVPLSSTLRMMVYMGMSDMAVATEAIEKRDLDSRPYTAASYMRSATLPVVAEGGAGRTADLEKIVALKPDVILTSFVDRQSADGISQKTGIPVIVLSYGANGYDENSFFASLKILGAISGKKRRAEELISYIRSLDAKLEGFAKGKTTQKAYIGGVANRGQHGIGSTEADFFGFKKSGLANAADATGKKGHLFLDKEFVLKANADVLFVDAGGYGNIAEEYAKEPKFFELIPAVKKGKVFMSLPNVFYGPNVETMYANAFFYAKSAYGVDINMEKTASEIFVKFTGKDAYPLMKARYGGYSKLLFNNGKIIREGR